MLSRQRVERTLIRWGKAAPIGLRGRVGRATRGLRRGWGGPQVTVVVAVSDTETGRIGPCLDSLRNQHHRNLDIRVTPFARADRALEVARGHAGEDWRIRIEPGAATRAEAWNAGAARSRARYVVFVSGGDDVPLTALERLVAAAEESGSDMTVGQVTPPFTLHASVDSPHDAAHRTVVTGTSLAASPVAITDLAVGNRLFRRSFWQRAALAFAPTDRLGTELALASYQRARRFDLLPDPAYVPTGRREGVSVGAVQDVLAGLEQWLEEHEATRAAVAALGMPDVMDWWLWGVLDSAIQPFIADVERATDHQWELLRRSVDRLVESGGDSAWASLRADSRARLWLVSHGERQRLEDYVTARFYERGHRRTEVRGGTVYAHLPFFGDPEVGIPDDVYEMRAAETPLWTQLFRVQWVASDRLELHCYSRVSHLSIDEEPAVRAWLVERGGDARTPLAVRTYADARANVVEGSRYQDYARGTVAITVETGPLAARALERGGQVAWTIELEMTVQGITRRGRIDDVEDRASAGMVETGHLAPRRVGAAKVGVRGRSASRFRLVASPADEPELVAASVDSTTVRGTVRPGAQPVTGLRLVEPGAPVHRVRTWVEDGLTAFSVKLPRPRPDDQPARRSLVADTAAGSVEVAWPREVEQWLGGPRADVALSRAETGGVYVVDALATLVVERVRLVSGAIEVDARWLGTAPASYRLALASQRVGIVADVREDGQLVHATFSTRWDEWGLGETLVPVGRLAFALTHGAAGAEGRVLLGEELLDQLLDFTVTDDYRFRAAREGRTAGVVLAPPLTDADRGPFQQARLQEAYQACERPIEQDLVYLQCYAGASASDSQLAIHEELRRSRPDLRIVWGVVDGASVVPEDAERVLMHSAAWYDVLATARYLCLNIDPDRWFRLRPGQELLQTFHGYPAKSMGIRMWEGKGYTPRRIDLELERTSADWSMILTPAPEMDVYYRTEYRYDGPIHSEGYPRDDLLVSAEAERVREETRARLGIKPGQRAVLYAPTWRDDLATNWRKAEFSSHIDLEDASRRLGPDYVLLLRGHRFHAQAIEQSDGDARLVDVTAYPEINHLILASDAAVLDYSSLRFDFALTGRPMVFLVPDLDTYTGGVRGFLYPFEESAPGPLVSTADEVVSRLGDLDLLQRQYAEPMAQFHERFNRLQDGHAAERVVRAFFR